MTTDHEESRDTPDAAEPRQRPPMAVFAGMLVVAIFTIAFVFSARETLLFVGQKTPVVTRVFYIATYGTFYFWPIFTLIFMFRGRHWAWISSQFIMILLMASLAFFAFMFRVKPDGNRLHSLWSLLGFIGVLAVFAWNAKSIKVRNFYK